MLHSIARNTALMTIASIGQKIISFVYFTMIARMVGVEGTGKYFFALSFTAVFVVFVDLGFTNVLIRESAKLKSKIGEYFSTVLAIKLLFGFFSYIAVVITINYLPFLFGADSVYDSEIRHMVYLSAVTMIFDSFHLTMYGMLRSIGNLKYEAVSIAVSQGTTLILGSIFIFFKFPLIFLILAFTIPSFLNFCFASFIVSHKYQISIIPKFNITVFKYLGKITIPFAIAGIFARVYSYIDSILISRLLDISAVGLYSIPYKITYAFQFIPLALVATIYPRFSEYFFNNKQKLSYIFEQGIKYLMIISFPIAVGIAVLARDIILTIYTQDYISSILPLRILIFSLIFSYLSFPIGAFLNACNKQVTQTVIVGTVMCLNIILNLLLIPNYGIAGASIAAFIGNFCLTIFGYLIVPKITKISHSFLLLSALRIGFAAIVMGLSVYMINSVSHFLFAILVGIVIYPMMLFVTKAVNMLQFKQFINFFNR